MNMQCFFPQYVVQQMRTPLFILNSAYDEWQVTIFWHGRAYFMFVYIAYLKIKSDYIFVFFFAGASICNMAVFVALTQSC